jgi:hypothetical protein
MKSEKNLIKYFFIGLAAFLGVLLVSGGGSSGLNQKEPSFERSSSGLIYFNNVRRYYYQATIDTASGYKINRFKKLYELDCNQPALRIFITENKNSSAFWLRFEPCDSLLIENDSFLHFDNQQINIRKMNAEQSYHFGEFLFNTFTNNNYASEIAISCNEKKYALFADEKERKQALRTLKDYFKLVGRIH